MNPLKILLPKTNTTATIVLVSCIVILISMFIWPSWFLNASVWFAILIPLVIFTCFVFAFAFYSIYFLTGTLPKVKEHYQSKQVNKTAINIFDMA